MKVTRGNLHILALAQALLVPVLASAQTPPPERTVVVRTSMSSMAITTGLGATQLSTAPTPPGPDAIQISLPVAVQRALTSNKQLAVRKLDPDVSVARVMVEQGAFDHAVQVTRDFIQHSETPTGSALEGAAVSVRDVKNFNVGIAARERIGTQHAIRLNNQFLETNSQFQNLNPQFTSNLIYQLTQPLLRNFGTKVNTANLRIAINTVRQNDLRLRQQVLNTVATTERQYWDLVFARQDRDVKRFSVAAANELLGFNQRRQEVGVGSEVEVIEARATAAARQQELELTYRQVSDAEEILRRLVALDDVPPGTEIFPKDQLPHMPPRMVLARALEIAYERRPDYRDLLVELKNRDIRVAFLKNQRLPRVDLVASYAQNGVAGTRDAALDQVGSLDFPAYTIGLQIEVPLENRTARGNYRVSILEKKQALLNVKAIQDQIEEEVSRAVRALDTDLRRVEVARLAQDLSAQQLRAAESRFREGLIPNIDLLRFQQDLANARSTAIRAVVDAVKDGITLEQVTGQLLDNRRIVMDQVASTEHLEGQINHPVVRDLSDEGVVPRSSGPEVHPALQPVAPQAHRNADTRALIERLRQQSPR